MVQDKGREGGTMAAKRKATRTRTTPTTEIITAVNLPADVLELLRLVAVRRATKAGRGRPSVSAVIVEVVSRCRRELEAELK